MTHNQIDYQKLEEERYHNRNVERETKRANEAQERLKEQTNQINAAHYMYSDQEQARHNQATEIENQRHNEASETISWFTAGSEDKLRKSQIELNRTQAARNEAETELTKAKTDTEPVTRANVLQQTLESISRSNQAKAQTELIQEQKNTQFYTTAKTHVEAALRTMDLSYYQHHETMEVAKTIGQLWSDFAGTIFRGYGATQQKPIGSQGPRSGFYWDFSNY